jgi:hypothetical protein
VALDGHEQVLAWLEKAYEGLYSIQENCFP